MVALDRVPRAAKVAVVAALAVALVAGGAYAATLQKNGGPVKAVRAVTADGLGSTTATTWTDVPGMSLTVGVPSGERGLLVITFAAMDHCTAGASAGYCNIRVLVDGAAAEPSQVVFDSTEDSGTGNVNSWETNSMQFVAGPIGAGKHTVRVQYSITGSATFSVAARTLTVLRARVR